MNAYLRTKTTSVSFLFLVFSLILFFLILSSNRARANPIQEQILNAGINLGWAKATLDFYGDQNPADARGITAALNRAAQHIQAAARQFEEPYQTERRNKGIDQRVIDKINRYFQQAPQLSISRKASYVQQIWSMYRQSFQTTWDSRQGYHYYPNCDFFMLDVGYHFGRAHIAAGVANNNRARTYQTGANGSMRNAIQNGLKVAVDGYEYGPQTNVRKACCCFGKEAFWRRLPTFQWNSPFALYANNLPVLQRIVLDAGVVPERCSCGGKRKGCEGIIGSWKWFNGIVVHIFTNNRFNSPAGNGGTWHCKPNGEIELIWDKGGWRDTLTISPDGNSLSGRNQHGVSVSATRMNGNENRERQKPRPRCTLDTSMMAGSSNLCTSFVEYHDVEKSLRTVHIVNDSHFQSGFNVPSNWYRGRYNECTVLSSEECK